jgi:hypothetical protein
MRSTLRVAALSAALAAIAPPSQVWAASPALSVQGGWWNLEADLQTRSGLFVDAGVPLAGVFLAKTTSGTSWFVPLELKLGYQLPLTRSLHLRLGARAAMMWSGEDPCGTGCDRTMFRSFDNLEVGLRYESLSGFVAGVELPVLTVRAYKESTWSAEVWPPGPSFAFSQLYLGYRWAL